MAEVGEYGENGIERGIESAKKGAVTAAQAGKAAAKIAKNVAEQNYVAAVKDAILNIDSLVKVIAMAIAVVAFILLIVFYSVPKMLLSTFSTNDKSFDKLTIEDIQDQYTDIKNDSINTFDGLIQEACVTANDAAQEYGEKLEKEYRNSRPGYNSYKAYVTTAVSDGSPIQSTDDIIQSIYILISLYDENQTNYANQDAHEYLENKIENSADGDITVEKLRNWTSEQFDLVTKNSNVNEFKRFMKKKAPAMLNLYLPTEYSPDEASLSPIYHEDSNTYCKVERTEVEKYDKKPAYTDENGVEHPATYKRRLKIYATYYWSMDFDGVNYLLQKYNWLERNSDGRLELTEEAEDLYQIVVEKADNFRLLDETGSLDFIAGGSQTFSGTFKDLYSEEYEQRIEENIRVDTHSQCPIPSIDSSYISSDFGEIRDLPSIGLYNDQHSGVDIEVGEGTPVYAPCDGEIIFSGWTNGSGYVIVLYAGTNGSSTYYFQFHHLSYARPSLQGHKVSKNDIIANTGNTGKYTTGPHLHFQLDKYDRNGIATHITPRILVADLPYKLSR